MWNEIGASSNGITLKAIVSMRGRIYIVPMSELSRREPENWWEVHFVCMLVDVKDVWYGVF